jgi:hypothetical protein
MLAFLLDNIKTAKVQKILIHFRTMFSYKDFTQNEILKKVLEARLSFLKLEVSYTPKFSWKICTNRFPVKNDRLKNFFKKPIKSTTLKFQNDAECSRFRREMISNEPIADFVFCETLGDQIWLCKTSKHFKIWQQQYEKCSKELDEYLSWMEIDRETFMDQKKLRKRVCTTTSKSAQDKKRKAEYF